MAFPWTAVASGFGSLVGAFSSNSNIKKQINDNSKFLVSHVMPKGHPFRDRNHFVFICKRIGDRIGFYDVVNNNYWQNYWHLATLKQRFGL